MLVYTDQLGSKISLSSRPLRVISLVPSQSEFLWDIGLKSELIGITKFCIHPQELYRTIERVGGTKQLDLKKIRKLKPDLIIGNKEENEKAQIEVLQNEFPVWMSDIYTLDDAFQMMLALGEIFDKKVESKKIVNEISSSVSQIKDCFKAQRVLYLIWNNPYMGIASNTFIDGVLNHIGLKNVLNDLSRYPELSTAFLKDLNPDYCFLSSEPFPFNQSHILELQEILPNTKLKLVDGEVFSWYGSRLLKLADYVNELKRELIDGN